MLRPARAETSICTLYDIAKYISGQAKPSEIPKRSLPVWNTRSASQKSQIRVSKISRKSPFCSVTLLDSLSDCGVAAAELFAEDLISLLIMQAV